MTLAFGLRRFHPRKSPPTRCPYCGAAATLVRRVPHPELEPSATLRTFNCIGCGPWSEITLGTSRGAQVQRAGAVRESVPARVWIATKELVAAARLH
jgi:hypothetical protein